MNKNNNFDIVQEGIGDIKKELGILSVGDINDAQDRATENEIEAELEAKDAYDEKLESEAREQTEDGIHPDCDPDAPNQNMVADPVGGTDK